MRALGYCLAALLSLGCSKLTEPSSDRPAPVVEVRAPLAATAKSAAPASAPGPAPVEPAAIPGRTRGPIMGAPVDANHVHAAHILISHQGAIMANNERSKEEAAKLAAELGAKAKKGGDFAALVKEYSDHPSSRKFDGDMGTFAREDLPKPFTDLAFALKPGQVDGPVQTQLGYHIIKRIE